MNCRYLHLNVDYLGSSGVMLSQEQKAAMQSSLIVAEHEERFTNIFFWGKILGLSADYFIVQGTNETGGAPHKMQAEGCFPTRRTLYSQDCVSWGLLTPATKDIKEMASNLRNRFTGDPSHIFQLPFSVIRKEEFREAEEEEEQEQEDEELSSSNVALKTETITRTLKEEDRLAALVAIIDEDVMIVPRGAYVRNSAGKIYRNKMFEGLPLPEANKLQYYFHFRKPIGMTPKTMLQRANLDSAIDFMDNIEDDLPNGRWSLQMERGGSVAILRNLDWLGYTFYHIPDTKEFGSAYFGTGENNIDLPFML